MKRLGEASARYLQEGDLIYITKSRGLGTRVRNRILWVRGAGLEKMEKRKGIIKSIIKIKDFSPFNVFWEAV